MTIYKGIKRYIFIYFVFMKNCLIKQMEYRANFFMMVFLESVFLGLKLLYTLLIYKTNVSLNGLPAESILLFSASFILMTGIYMSFFFFNFSNISKYIGDGSLDLFITKPISLQFITTLRNVDFGTALPNLIGGLILLVIGWKRCSIPVSPQYILGYIGFIMSGAIVVYAVMLAPQLLNFLIIKGFALTEISDALWDANNMPMVIYTKWMQAIGTYIIPLFLISNYASLFILGKLNLINIIWGILAPVIFLALVRLLWQFLMKYYTSASS